MGVVGGYIRQIGCSEEFQSTFVTSKACCQVRAISWILLDVTRAAIVALLPLALACQDGILVGPTDARPPTTDTAPPDWGRLDALIRDASHETRRDTRPPDVQPRDLPSPDMAPACPTGMVQLGKKVCMDRYEAPNSPGQLPLVMYTFTESELWCKARAKRLCFDDEWTLACASPTGNNTYPYGTKHQPGICNDDKKWKTYSQTKLSGWPKSASSTQVATLAQLLAAAGAVSSTAKTAADHIQALYQGTAAGAKKGCVGPAGVFDLVGNVEEWTRRRDGGRAQFHGALKGRYWAEPRTCQSAVKTHGDAFRFYEIGFRCCKDRP